MLKDYLKAKDVLKKLREESEKEGKEKSDELRKAHYFYTDKISVLENKKNDLSNKITKNYNIKDEKRKLIITPLSEEVQKVERGFKFVDLIKGGLDVDTSFSTMFPKYKENYYIEELQAIYDSYSTLKVFISENDKPVNKYSLIICGRHIYNDLIDSRCCLTPFYCDGDGHFQIEKIVKDASTIEALQSLYERNKDKLLKPFIDELTLASKELARAVEDIKDPVYQREYTKWKMDYYENCYSHGTETDEYKALVKELVKLEV